MRYTVADLLELLATVPPETPVLVSGYEGGLTECIAPLRVARARMAPWHDEYSGEFNEAEGASQFGVMNALFIERDGMSPSGDVAGLLLSARGIACGKPNHGEGEK